ncbi:Uncharacterized protein Fot_34863 [Forsythia ovata]|uniref:Uncharacterized protein n=1 Tax=Forsythia ovata TaxID=205694 RepID=A0ABD1SK76_9LAMI
MNPIILYNKELICFLNYESKGEFAMCHKIHDLELISPLVVQTGQDQSLRKTGSRPVASQDHIATTTITDFRLPASFIHLILRRSVFAGVSSNGPVALKKSEKFMYKIESLTTIDQKYNKEMVDTLPQVPEQRGQELDR